MCKRFVYRYEEEYYLDENGKVKGNHIHYNRRRWLQTKSGEKIHPMTTRYAWGMDLRNATGPRGGKALSEHPKNVYYLDGRFYKSEKVHVNEYEWAYVITPLDGEMWDVHSTQSGFEGIPVVRIRCEDGWPVSITMEGEEMPMTSDYWPMAEEMLGIMKKPRMKSGPKGPRKR